MDRSGHRAAFPPSPVSGNLFETPAATIPGSACRRSRAVRMNVERETGVEYRWIGRLTSTVMTRLAANPASTCSSFEKLWSKSPPAMRHTALTPTSQATRSARRRPVLRADVTDAEPDLRASIGLRIPRRQAGSTPTSTPAISDTHTVNARTRGSISISFTRGKSAGALETMT